MELKNTRRQYFLLPRIMTCRTRTYLRSNRSGTSLSRFTLFGATLDIVMIILSPIFKMMKLIHSLTNIGGSLTEPGNRVVGLVGMVAESVPILISDQLVGTNLNIDVPFVKYIQLVRTKADFNGIEFKPSEKYLGTSFVLLPPS